MADIDPKDNFIQKPSPEVSGSSNYLISFHEFRQLIPNLLLKFPFCAIGFTEEHIQLLWQATSHGSIEAYQAKDALRWSHNEATIEVARQLRFNYEMLRRADEDGCLKAKVGARQGCSCMEGLADRSILVEDALAAFEGRASTSPIIPPPELPCCFNQDAQTPCDCYILGHREWDLGDVGSPPVGSLDIEKRGYEILQELKGFVEKTPEPDAISQNWKNILLADAANRVGRKLKEAIAYRDRLNSVVDQGSNENSETLSCSMNMHDLRLMQKKYGLRGFRSKIDVAAQIVSHGPATAEVSGICSKRNADLDKEANSDVESLTAQMRDIWNRMQDH